MAEQVVLAVDQGTTGSTAMLWSTSRGVIAKCNHEFAQHFPKPGWVEHQPDEIWQSVEAAISEVLEESGFDANNIAALGITNQRETSLIWERETLQSPHPAIVWQDRRTASRCQELRAAGKSELVKERSGLVLDPYFSASKYEWLLSQDTAWRDPKRFALGTVESWLIAKMSGGRVHVSDESNASRTMLCDIRKGAWDTELCALFSIDQDLLPRIVGNAEKLAHTSGMASLPDGIPITGVAGDQQSALFGQQCFAAGEAKCTYGTGAFLLMNVGPEVRYSERGMLSTTAWQIKGERTFALEGSAFVAGSAVQWLRDGLKIIDTSPEVETRAGEVESSEGVFVVPAFTGLGAPHWEADARGTITGLTRGTSVNHICRATLEGVAHQIVDLVESMNADAPKEVTTLRVDGGMSANNLFLQTQADLLRLPVERPKALESTAIGAASLAALGAGVVTNLQELKTSFQLDRAFSPAAENKSVERERQGWRKAVDATLAASSEGENK